MSTQHQKQPDSSHHQRSLNDHVMRVDDQLPSPPVCHVRNGGVQLPSRCASTVVFSRSPTVVSTASTGDEAEFPRMNIRLASAFTVLFVLGWGDGVTGTLLPYFKNDFQISFLLSSLCFVASTFGFGVGTVLGEPALRLAGNIYLSSTKSSFLPALPRLSRLFSHKSAADEPVGHSALKARFLVVFLASLVHPVFFVIMGLKKNFASVLIAFMISSFARSFLTLTMNHYCASTPKRALGYMYGYWAIGSMCAPLVCQSIIATGVPWNHFYFGSLVLSGLSSAFCFFAFRPSQAEFEQDLRKAKQAVRVGGDSSPTERGGDEKEKGDMFSPIDEKDIGLPVLQKGTLAPQSYLAKAFKDPVVWAHSIFCWAYVGAEASTQGFIVSYLLAVRNASPDTVGYATSGFWGGLALSRFIWNYMVTRMTFTQRKYTIHACIVLALSMQLLIWFVDSFIQNAFSTAIIGFAYGPIFVGNMGQANDVLPEELHMAAMAVLGAFGSFGSALFPFVTGLISNFDNPRDLPYITVAQTGFILIMWCFFPSKNPRA